MSELTAFRAEKDEFFKDHPQSPLTPEQKRNFKGLEYFPENEGLRLEVEVTRLFEQEPMQMQTSTGGVQTYVRHSRFKFQVEGQEAELTIYQNENGYFLPFVDSLAGKESAKNAGEVCSVFRNGSECLLIRKYQFGWPTHSTSSSS